MQAAGSHDDVLTGSAFYAEWRRTERKQCRAMITARLACSATRGLAADAVRREDGVDNRVCADTGPLSQDNGILTRRAKGKEMARRQARHMYDCCDTCCLTVGLRMSVYHFTLALIYAQINCETRHKRSMATRCLAVYLCAVFSSPPVASYTIFLQ